MSDELQKDLWDLRSKYGLHIKDIKLKIDQMIMEHELAWQSGLQVFEYKDFICIIDRDEE